MITKIIGERDNKNYFISTKEISLDKVTNLNNPVTKEILNLISNKAMYPKEIAKAIKVHEQNIYYYIKKLEKTNLIKIEKSKNINGTIANYYKVSSDSFYFKFKEFKESSKISQKEATYLKPFIENSSINALIVVGSPDPHGPQKARSRDGYFGMDLALFIGSYINEIPELKVRLDTEITQKEIEENNLIVIGGPIVNKITNQINNKMQIYFDDEKKGIYSHLTKKTYYGDEIGVINKFESPYNPKKEILLIAGIRNKGTKSCILSFLKHFSKLEKGNITNNKIFSNVVEGLDLDSDGKIDDVEFLE